ncbi:MAG: diphthamide biosynthesis enzyme Dph2 [Candidatus Aenigmarchaeota archaeon]|nr:diphthamide biosynthesis enzyme Dph2 [Candidatus Aenigmarchaeota archaeon]
MDVIEELRNVGARRVFLQLPEGLFLEIEKFKKMLEENGFEVVICLEPTYGACDVRDEEAIRLGCDAILHVGHTDFGVKSKIPVIYWEYVLEKKLDRKLKSLLKRIKEKRVGLVASVQYIKLMEEVREFLESNGKVVCTRKILKYPGQVIGCNVKAATSLNDTVDCFVCVSSGKFHALGVSLEVTKPVYLLDVELKKLVNMEKEKRKYEKIVAWNKSALEEAKKVGILVSWKKGQLNTQLLEIVKSKLEAMGKEVFVLAFDTIAPEKLEGLKFDVFINLACPRIGIDDIDRFKTPVINAIDLLK